MKVKQLLATLQSLDPELDIVLAKDREGNDFSPLDMTSEEHYIPTTTWYGEIQCYDEDEDQDAPNAICLWPVN